MENVMRAFFYGYKFNSGSILALIDTLREKDKNVKRIRNEKSSYTYKLGDVVFNWGCSNLPEEVMKAEIINNPDLIGVCSNKLSFFRALDNKNVNTPEWTTNPDVVKDWVDKGGIAFARKVLQGHSGEGIVEIDSTENIEQAPLYTKYIPKRHEYRIHVFDGNFIGVQRKARNRDNQDPNWRIRSYNNGFVFARNEDHVPPNCVFEQAQNAMNSIGLTFGAVDVIYNEYREQAYVLEINTAPGLVGETVNEYANEFIKILDKYK